MRRALTAFAALSLPLALCVAPGPASSAEPASSTVKITRATAHAAGTTVRGKVTSGTPSCKKSRKVTVYHDVAPDGPSAGDFRLGTVETNKRGRWRLDTPYFPDRVRAKVRSNSDCGGDKSRTVPVSA